VLSVQVYSILSSWFTNVKDVEAACLEFFSSKWKEWYLSGIQEVAERWLNII